VSQFEFLTLSVPLLKLFHTRKEKPARYFNAKAISEQNAAFSTASTDSNTINSLCFTQPYTRHEQSQSEGSHSKVRFLVLFGKLGLIGGEIIPLFRSLLSRSVRLSSSSSTRNLPLCVGLVNISPTRSSHAASRPKFSSAGTIRMVLVWPIPPRQPWTQTTLSP
jgi:hypothetical protein